METNEYNPENENKAASNSRIWTGLILLIIGGVFLMRNFGVEVPEWVISWHMALVVIGLVFGIKRRFKGIGWIVMVLVAGSFTISAITERDLTEYSAAIVLIVVGTYLILKPKRSEDCRSYFKERRFRRRFGGHHITTLQTGDTASNAEDPKSAGSVYRDKSDNDLLESINVFGGSTQSVFSKNFKGGEIIAVFGGCDINLTQADFNGTIELEVVAIFGGAKILVPQSWEVKSEVTAIFGGLDDKRGMVPINTDDRKLLIIKGVALFGGVEIKNF